MLSTSIGRLVERFDNDIVYDAHSLRARIGRSDAAREIEVLSETEKDAIRMYLQTREPVTEIPALREDLRSAWIEVLG